MRSFRNGKRFVWLFALSLFIFISAIDGVCADDKTATVNDTGKSSAANGSAKIDAPNPGLTERERRLLDRVE